LENQHQAYKSIDFSSEKIDHHRFLTLTTKNQKIGNPSDKISMEKYEKTEKDEKVKGFFEKMSGICTCFDY